VFPVPSWSVMASKEDAENSICDVNTNLWVSEIDTLSELMFYNCKSQGMPWV
jgi:hypothetical protein